MASAPAAREPSATANVMNMMPGHKKIRMRHQSTGNESRVGCAGGLSNCKGALKASYYIKNSRMAGLLQPLPVFLRTGGLEGELGAGEGVRQAELAADLLVGGDLRKMERGGMGATRSTRSCGENFEIRWNVRKLWHRSGRMFRKARWCGREAKAGARYLRRRWQQWNNGPK